MARISLSLPDSMLKKVDQAAKAEHLSRSQWITNTTRYYIMQRALANYLASRKIKRNRKR